IRHMMIHGLDEQCPWLVRKLAEPRLGKRPPLHDPPIGRLGDQSRFHVALTGKPGQFVGIEGVEPSLPRISDQNRLLLPVSAEEYLKIEIDELHVSSRRFSVAMGIGGSQPGACTIASKSTSGAGYVGRVRALT